MKPANHYRVALHSLIKDVNKELGNLDREMVTKESPERGKKIAEIANRMDMAIDAAMHFGLDMSFDKIEEYKRKTRP